MKQNVQIKLLVPDSSWKVRFDSAYQEEGKIIAFYVSSFSGQGDGRSFLFESTGAPVEVLGTDISLPVEYYVLVGNTARWEEQEGITFCKDFPVLSSSVQRIDTPRPRHNPDAPPKVDSSFFSSSAASSSDAGSGASRSRNPDAPPRVDLPLAQSGASRENPLIDLLTRLGQLSPEERCIVRGLLGSQDNFSFSREQNSAQDLKDVTRILVASHREFNLSEFDARIEHDKPWGPRDWAIDCPTATSCLVPVDAQEIIKSKLNARDDVIFSCHQMDEILPPAYRL